MAVAADNESSRLADTVRTMLRQRNAKFLVGAFMVAIVALIAVLAPLIAPHDPIKIGATESLMSPNSTFLLGTDQLGRDVLSRLMFGARQSLLVGIVSISIALVVGTVLGLMAGYFGGIIDDIIMRTADVIFAFPALILALVIISILGVSTVNVIIAIATFVSPGLARVARASTLVVKQELYTEAARAMGTSDFRMMRYAILPNIVAPLIVVSTLQIPGAIIAEAGLSFLGLGTPLPAATWGSMLNQSRVFMQTAPWLVLAPGVAIAITLVGFALFGDALRDILDPRTQSGRTAPAAV